MTVTDSIVKMIDFNLAMFNNTSTIKTETVKGDT